MTSPRLPGGDGSTGPRSPRLSPVLWAARQASGAYETQLPVASGVGMTHRLNSTRGQTGHSSGLLARRACSLRPDGVRFEAFLLDLTGRALRGVRPLFCEAQWTTRSCRHTRSGRRYRNAIARAGGHGRTSRRGRVPASLRLARPGGCTGRHGHGADDRHGWSGMTPIHIAADDLRRMVERGVSDATIARWRGCSAATVIRRRLELGLRRRRKAKQ